MAFNLNKKNVFFIYLAAIIFLTAPAAQAACTGASPTWTATSDQSSVSNCVASAIVGDTINVLAGSSTWTSPLTITK